MERISGIYSITNKINGKVYYGSSVNCHNRMKDHFLKLRKNIHDNEHLQSSYNFYGIDNFEFKMEEIALPENLRDIEQYYLDWIFSINPSIRKTLFYNLSKDAFSPMRGLKQSNEFKQMMSKRMSGKNHPSYGKPKSEETLLKQKNSIKKYYENNKAAFYDRRHSEESNEKNRLAHLGKKLSKQHKEKIKLHSIFGNRENNPNFDKTIHTFKNIVTNEIFVGYQYDFYKKYNLRNDKVCELIKGTKKSYLKWIVS